MSERAYHFEIAPRSAFSFGFRELLAYKELFYFFAWRDVKVKYKQTTLGLIWAVIQPLSMTIILTYFIGDSVKSIAPRANYPLFAFSGLILWTFVSSGITNAGSSMIVNAQIIKKIYFPRLIIPVSSILVAVVDFAVGFAALIVLLYFFRSPVDILDAVIYWPAGFFIAMVGTFGPGCFLAALNVKYRDFRYVIPFLVQVLLFISPVIYPISVSSSWAKYLLAANPMYAAMTIFRVPITGELPEASLLWISVVSGVVLAFAGLGYFRKTEAYFADLA